MINFTFKHVELLAGTKNNNNNGLLRKHIVRWRKDDLGIHQYKEKESKWSYHFFFNKMTKDLDSSDFPI